MTEQSWLAPITQFLGSLPPTGSGGFEGLVSDLCEVATGQRFVLSGSGSQHGQDARSEVACGNRIKVEVKHYMKRALDLRELIGELAQATSSSSGVDLWVLVASCAVQDQHRAALEKQALKESVEIFFIDLGNDGLPRLAVFMAAFPARVENWIHRNRPDLQGLVPLAALREVAAEPNFASARDHLLYALRNTLLGYADALERSRRSLLSTLGDHGNALAAFNQPVAIRSKDVTSIPRVGLQDCLSAWWTSQSQRSKRAVVVGEDGTGKTWVALDWIAERLGTGQLPLVLPFFAAAESIPAAESLESFLPKLLAKWTAVRDAEFWSLRVNRWLTTVAPPGPLFLIFVDGLNERPTVEWPSFLRNMDGERWRDRVALLVTDRRQHWNERCQSTGIGGFQEIVVGGYGDRELDQALAGGGVGFSEIPFELQALVRKPRYCTLVCRHFREMAECGDFTVERLILFDIKDRIERKRGTMTVVEFIEIIRNLASRYRENPTIRLSMLPAIVPCADPDRRIHQEILDGGLLVPKAGVGSGYTVEHSRLVFGLGMLLCEQLREASERTGTRQTVSDLESWFEPHPEMDLKVEICGAALFHSLTDSSYPQASRRALLRYWLGLRNWQLGAQEAFADYVRRCPEDFITVAEDFWTSVRNVGGAQDFLATAFIRHRDDPAVRPGLVAAVTRWMGFVHPAGHPVMRTGTSDDRQRERIQARVGHALEPGKLEICGEALTVVSDEGLLRLSRFGFLIMSAGPRLEFVPSLVRWAVASAVMGHAMEASVADWVVRLTDEPLDGALLDAAQKLLDANDPLAREAAHILLYRLGSASAANLRQKYPTPENEQWRRLREDHVKDPCRSFLEWSDADCNTCIQRSDVPLHMMLSRVGDHIFDPDAPFSSAAVSQAMALLDVDPMIYRASLSRPADIHWLEEAIPLLAHRAPSSLCDFFRKVVATFPSRNPEQLYAAAMWLPEVSLILHQAEQAHVSEARRRLSEIAQDPSTNGTSLDWKSAEALAFLAQLPPFAPLDRLTSLLARGVDSRDLTRFEPWFEIPSDDQVRWILEQLRSAADNATVVRILWYLSTFEVCLTEIDRAWIAQFARSRDETVRATALRFVCSQKDEELGRKIVDCGESYRQGSETYLGRWGSRALVQFGGHLEFESLAARVHPAVMGYAVVERGSNSEELRFYGRCLEEIHAGIISAPPSQVPSLPPIKIGAETNDDQASYLEIEDEPETGWVFKNASTTWRAGKEIEGKAKLVQSPAVRLEELDRRFEERAAAIVAAWRTDDLQWLGVNFSRKAMRGLWNQDPQMIRRWVERVVRDSPSARIIHSRLASLFAALYPVLWEEDSDLGFELWNALRKRSSGFVRFDACSTAFFASENTRTEKARWELLTSAQHDHTIAELVYTAEVAAKGAWLNSALERLITDRPLYRRALGLTMASYSDISVEQFEEHVSSAQITDTWVESQLRWLRGNVRRNRFARHWFQTFLASDDCDVSWGALQIMLRCGDKRFFLWRGSYENEGGNHAARRLRYVDSMDHHFQQKLDRERLRKETLFGIKVERGEVFPFLEG